MDMITKQNFGIEIELTGITRRQAVKVIADHFGGSTGHIGGTYDTYTATDHKGRTWKAMTDSSIRTYRRVNGNLLYAGREYSCEVVSPILQYDDLSDLQEIVRALRTAGAFANDSCGIHVHVDGANHTPDSLYRLLNLAVGRQDLIYEALGIGARAGHWCKKISPELVGAMKKGGHHTKEEAEKVWYSNANDGYTGGVDHYHYNPTRYHGVNLHAFFSKGTVEFRLFNSTTHAGKIKAYVQFCLAMSAWAIEGTESRLFFKSCVGYTQAQKAKLMKNVLVHRLGMSGPEFKTARYHLTKAFATDSAVSAA